MISERTFQQVLRYLIAGGAGMIFYYIPLYVLTEFVGVWYLFSAAVGAVLSFLVNFILKKFWAFGNDDRLTMRRELAHYLVLSVVLVVSNLGALFLLVEFARLPYLFAQVLLSTVLTPVAFLLTRRIFVR